MTSDQPGKKGSGTVMILQLPDPAAGANWVHIVLPGTRERIMGFYYELTCDATIVDRFMGYAIRAAAIKPTTSIYNATAITAGLTGYMSVMAQAHVDPALLVATYLVLPMPEVYLDGTMWIESQVLGMVVGDQITNPSILLERWAIG